MTVFLREHADEYGIPLNSEQGKHTNSAWTVWTSATMTDTQSRNLLLGKLKSWLSDERAGSRPFGGWYGTSKEQNIDTPAGGDYERMAVVGGHCTSIVPFKSLAGID